MRNMKIYILVMIGIVILAMRVNPANSQWYFNLNFDQEYNDNPFWLHEAQESWISTINFSIQKEFEKIFIGYQGSYAYFNNILARNFYYHKLAIGGGTENTNWRISGEQRFNKSDYDIYDYTNAAVYFQHRFNLLGIMTTWNGTVNFNQYNQLAELNNWKLSTTIRFHKSFPTRTSFISGISANYKTYINEGLAISTYPDSTTTSMVFSSYASLLGNGGGGNRYRRHGGYFSSTSYMNLEAPAVSQIVFWARLAQSITPITGLALQYQTRKLVSGTDRYISGLSHSYSQESSIFDDPMSYESYSLIAEVTQLLPLNITLKIIAYYMPKNYSAQGIYLDEESYDETTLREDKYRIVSVALEKKFSFNFSDLAIYFDYQWLKNESNSYWYNYSNNYAAMGFEFQF